MMISNSRSLALNNRFFGISSALAYIDRNFSEEIFMTDVAKAAFMSISTFYICFKTLMGVTPNYYIIRLRIEKAKSMLKFTDDPIGKVGSECGFSDFAYFCQIFKREVGMTPKKFRIRNKILF